MVLVKQIGWKKCNVFTQDTDSLYCRKLDHLQFKFNGQATKSCEKMPWTYKDTGVAPGEIFFYVWGPISLVIDHKPKQLTN